MNVSIPKVSIIIPCYGVEKFLDRCMKTVLNQTLKDIEIILVDDESPDRVPQMVDEYAKQDSRIKVIHKKNGGLGYARNSGIEIATGEYVAFIDSDDFVDVQMYAKLHEIAEREDADAVFCGFKNELKSDVWQIHSEVETQTKFKGIEITDLMLDMVASAQDVKQERKYYMSVWHSIYRRSIIVKNNLQFPSERDVVSEDLPFQVDFLMVSDKIVYIPDTMYYYCLNETSLTTTFKPEKFERFVNLYYIIKGKLQNTNGGDIRSGRFLCGYTRSHIHHLMISKYPNKGQHLKDIVNHHIWVEIKNIYPLKSVKNIYQKMMYQMILHKNILGLMLFSKMINLLRKS